MPLPRKINRTPEQEVAATAYAARERAAMLQRAPAEARRWIAAGGVAEVRGAWLNARDRGDAELQAIYADVLTAAGEKNPINATGRWE
ncbi:MAG: hypothetical protein KBA18_09100 [Kiritimatiellae bacterium]|nr:hypothetical protein [Kiritimatiellia bacterium]